MYKSLSLFVLLLSLPAAAAPSPRSCSNADEDFLRDALDNGKLVSGTPAQLSEARDLYSLQFSSDSIYTVVLCNRLVDKTNGEPRANAKFSLALHQTYYIDIATDADGKQAISVREVN